MRISASVFATSFAVFFAGLAALAASVQAYVSWSGRYDVLKATLAAEASTQCTEAASALRRLSIQIVSDPFPSNPALESAWMKTNTDMMLQIMDQTESVVALSKKLKAVEPDLIGEFLKIIDSLKLLSSETPDSDVAAYKYFGQEVTKLAPLLRRMCSNIQSSVIGD